MTEPATRGALLRLREEERSMQEGYELLDQKRILLVQEIKRQLAAYDREKPAFSALYGKAQQALRQAVGRHGLEGLEAYPPLPWKEPPQRHLQEHNLLGVRLQSVELSIAPGDPPPADNPSPEADMASRLFINVLSQGIHLAAREANLQKLLREYRRTERRARALEEVLLPELRTRIKAMTTALEDIDQEEALRVIGHQPQEEA